MACDFSKKNSCEIYYLNEISGLKNMNLMRNILASNSLQKHKKISHEFVFIFRVNMTWKKFHTKFICNSCKNDTRGTWKGIVKNAYSYRLIHDINITLKQKLVGWISRYFYFMHLYNTWFSLDINDIFALNPATHDLIDVLD